MIKKTSLYIAVLAALSVSGSALACSCMPASTPASHSSKPSVQVVPKTAPVKVVKTTYGRDEDKDDKGWSSTSRYSSSKGKDRDDDRGSKGKDRDDRVRDSGEFARLVALIRDNKWDRDNDGKLDRQDYKNLVGALRSPGGYLGVTFDSIRDAERAQREKERQEFQRLLTIIAENKWDRNNDGKLDRQDYKNLAAALRSPGGYLGVTFTSRPDRDHDRDHDKHHHGHHPRPPVSAT